MLNLASIVDQNARDFPQAVAVESGGARLTFLELREAVDRAAQVLAGAGIGRGDKVAIICPTTHHFPICFYAIAKLGAVSAAISPALRTEDMARLMRASDCVACIAHEGNDAIPLGRMATAAAAEAGVKQIWLLAEDPARPARGARDLMREAEQVSGLFETTATAADDTYGIIFTSGTTGIPKGAELTHANYVMNSLFAREALQYTPGDRVLVPVPLYHVLGQTLKMGAAFAGGATLVLMPRFDPVAVLMRLEAGDINVFSGVAAMFHPMLAMAEGRRARWQRGIVGGMPVPEGLLATLKTTFGAEQIIGYGLTETTAATTTTRPGEPQITNCVGRPLWGVEVRIVRDDGTLAPAGERGEVQVRGHNVMKGYYKRPDANAEALRDHWLLTGDIGALDDEGRLYILDRKKDMIIRNGLKIYPSEIEIVLARHPGISAAAVIGLPDVAIGEEVTACIVRRAGAEIDENGVLAWARENLPPTMYPRKVFFVDALPLGLSGKVLKSELRKRFGGEDQP